MNNVTENTILMAVVAARPSSESEGVTVEEFAPEVEFDLAELHAMSWGDIVRAEEASTVAAVADRASEAMRGDMVTVADGAEVATDYDAT